MLSDACYVAPAGSTLFPSLNTRPQATASTMIHLSTWAVSDKNKKCNRRETVIISFCVVYLKQTKHRITADESLNVVWLPVFSLRDTDSSTTKLVTDL